MLQLTIAQLARIYPAATRANIEKALPSLNETLRVYKIDTIRRVSCFLGQLGVESGELRYTRELWGPTTQQKRYERDFSQPFNSTNYRNKLAYALGNSQKGDGYLMRGEGYIQTTGRTNKTRVANALGILPSQLGELPYAALSAGYYWDSKNLNPLADYLDVEAITLKVNGGYTALDKRIEYTNNALSVLGEDVRVEKKKKLVPFLIGATLVLALILFIYNYQPILTWIKKQRKSSTT